MKILFISKELIAADLAYRLKKEGCDVRLFIEGKGDKNCFDGMVVKTNNWKKELKWVGKNGLIIFDDTGYGKIQDKLRRDGYLVIGGSGDGDELELNRSYGQEIFKKCGIKTNNDFETKSFTIKTAISFIKKNKGRWVLKQENHDEAFTYIGEKDDASDMLNLLENYKDRFGENYRCSLQKKVSGVEIAIGRFFNGNDWVGPLIFNVEHKHFCNGNIGPLGGETGTLMWYDKNENKKLFQETLAKLKPHLQKSNYKGYIDINCIVVDRNTVYPLEITSRFGSSTNEMQSEIQTSPWNKFLIAIAKGEEYNLKYKKGYGIAVALTVSPFPYKTSDKSLSQKGVSVFFDKKITEKDLSHVHFEEIALKKEKGKEEYYIAGNTGYIIYVTNTGKTIYEARNKAYKLVSKIIIPKMFYRTDIGLRFVEKDYKILKKLGWI